MGIAGSLRGGGGERMVRAGGGHMQLPRGEVLRVLRHAGLPEVADAIGPELPDVVDVDRDRSLFDRHGVSLELLVSRLGGSP